MPYDNKTIHPVYPAGLREREDARIFAVGDDWQSIYRFAGSDIHLMRNFGTEFGGTYADETGVHRTVDLGRTFRSVDKIALAARRFVLCNPAQITKTVVPAGETDQPAIRIAWTRRETGAQVMDETLSAILNESMRHDRKPTVLLLGRYRFIEPDIRDLRRKHPDLEINFKTIHASKGLEADYVIILGADNARMGFPSMIVDHPLLGLVSPETEPFANAEERRVMYVAMTRARSTVTIMASEARPSAFVTELLHDPAYEVASPREAMERRPEDYFPEIEAAHPGALQSQWIPQDPNLWKVENYRDFIEARKELLADAANECLASLLHGDTAILEGSRPARLTDNVLLGGITSQEEANELEALNDWVAEQGYVWNCRGFVPPQVLV